MTRIVARNSAFGMAAQITIKILSFVFSVLIVRRLGAEVYGQYAAVIAFGVTFAFIGDLGLSPYLVREIARLRDAPDGLERARALYGDVLVLRLALSLVAAVAVTATAWLAGRPLVMVGAIALNALGLLLYGVQGSSDAALAGFERLDITSGAKVISQLVFVLLGAAALLTRSGYYGLVLANVLGVAAMTLVCWQGVRSLGLRPARPHLSQWLPLLRAALPFGVIALALGLSYKFDSVLLNIVRGDAETGYYNAAYNLVFSAVVISNVVNTALYPSLARHSVREPETLARIYERAFRYLMLISLPIAAGISVLAGPVVAFLYGSGYDAAIPALRVIIWAVPLMFASEFLGYVVVIGNMERLAARSIVISTLVNVAANLILVPRYGFIAAAWMTVATEAVLVAQYLWILRRRIGGIAWQASMLRPLAAALLMAGIVILLRARLPLVALAGLGAAVYLALGFLFSAVRLDDLRFLRSLRSASNAAAE